jgi:hypothetical protein
MAVEHLEVMVEEPSMEAALERILPKIVGDLSFAIYPHQCKGELLQRLPERLQGYSSWLPPTWRILVVVDRDDDDCGQLKMRLEKIVTKAGLGPRAHGREKVCAVTNRIAIEELEAWYFGDWEAVRAAYPRVSQTIPAQAKYRDPDAIGGGTWEALERVLQGAGYFKGGLRKIEAARTIAAEMDPERNRSRSFQTLRRALLAL